MAWTRGSQPASVGWAFRALCGQAGWSGAGVLASGQVMRSSAAPLLGSSAMRHRVGNDSAPTCILADDIKGDNLCVEVR